MKTTIVFDTETTGLPLPSSAKLEDQPRIIELGIIRLHDRQIVASHEWMFHPGVDVSAEITKITGITNEMLKGKPTFASCYDDIAAAFAGADAMVAHNAQFDIALMTFDLKRCGKFDDFPWPPEAICTVQEFKHEFGYRPRMTDLYLRKCGKPLEQTHRALDDVKALVEIILAAEVI